MLLLLWHCAKVLIMFSKPSSCLVSSFKGAGVGLHSFWQCKENGLISPCEKWETQIFGNTSALITQSMLSEVILYIHMHIYCTCIFIANQMFIYTYFIWSMLSEVAINIHIFLITWSLLSKYYIYMYVYIYYIPCALITQPMSHVVRGRCYHF